MSSYNDYIVASNNSVNENYLNAKKARSTKYQIKQLLKPIFAVIKKNKKNTYKKTEQPEYFADCEIEDNYANELLEARIFEEIDTCEELSGVPVYTNDSTEVLPVYRGQDYIPVHFAKTEAGTFFWTSVSAADSDISCHGDRNAITEHQTPQSQVACDRWAQA